MHGTIMVFFVLTTAPQGGFGNYFLPIQIGAEDMAFPVLNMLSFWVTFVGFIVILAGNLLFSGMLESTVGPIGGWTGYAPLSALGTDRRTRAGHGHEPLDHQHRDLLRRFAARRAELHHDAAQHAHARNVADAHAADLLGLVHHRGAGAACRSRCCSAAAFCCCSIALPEQASSFPAVFMLVAFCQEPIQTFRFTPAGRRSSGNTCSGSSDTRRSTSRFCRAWAPLRTSSPPSRASRSLVIARWCLRSLPSDCWASLSGATTCSSVA